MLSDVTEATVYSVVESVIRIIAKDPQLAVGSDSELLTDLGLSSINVVMLLTEVCEQLEFDIFNFSESDLGGVKTVGDLVGLLGLKGRAGAGAGGSCGSSCRPGRQ